LDKGNTTKFSQVFDKVIVLYEGRQIYFGPSNEARSYFERLGFEFPASQTTPDFLTSMTSPSERRIRKGFENTTPRTSDDFARCWKESPERQHLLQAIDEYNNTYPLRGEQHDRFALSRTLEKSKKQRQKSPYTLSYWSQIRLCMWRDVQRLKNDPSVPLTMLIVNFFEALIIASIFYNLPQTTASFFKRGGVLFMVVLLNAFGSMLEIMNLYAKRTIVEKHARYALYHPSAEALSSMIVDLPYKITNSLVVNTTLYFMANLRREPGPYFYFLIVGFTTGLSMSMFFRLFASMTKTLAQALAPSSLILIMLVLYTGFAIPVQYMKGWAGWFQWINPVAYGFENVMVNEFHGRTFECSSFVPSGPSYENVAPEQRACAVQGSQPGLDYVSGTAYVETAFRYQYSERWSNYGIILAITVILFLAHLIMSELVASERSKGEVLVFRRSKMRKTDKKQGVDEETGRATAHEGEKISRSTEPEPDMQKQVSIFHWEKVTYEVQIKGETRTILDGVDGYIKPGTLTALMVRQFDYPSESQANIFSGCFRRREDHTTRCSCISNDNGCDWRRHACRWPQTRRVIPTPNRICHTAGHPFGYFDRTRSAGVFCATQAAARVWTRRAPGLRRSCHSPLGHGTVRGCCCRDPRIWAQR
jgi:ATP-binding cassette subfamily G (WHITE) protein 2 (PDR)